MRHDGLCEYHVETFDDTNRKGTVRFLRAATASERLSSWNSYFPLRSMRTFWSGAHAASDVSAQASGEKEESQKMARRKLSLLEQLKGIRAALQSPRTPPQLKEGLRRRAEMIEKQVGSRRRN